MRFLDTNIFIRYLTRDDPEKADACLALFRRLEAGAEEATTCEAVVSEVVDVLASPRTGYGLDRDDIRARLAPLLTLRGLYLADRSVHLHALDIYVEHSQLDFEDALIAAHMHRQGLTDVLSYDTGFDRLPGVTRVEP